MRLDQVIGLVLGFVKSASDIRNARRRRSRWRRGHHGEGESKLGKSKNKHRSHGLKKKAGNINVAHMRCQATPTFVTILLRSVKRRESGGA